MPVLRDSRGRFVSARKAKVESGQAALKALDGLTTSLLDARRNAQRAIDFIKADICEDYEANDIVNALGTIDILISTVFPIEARFASYVRARNGGLL